MNDKSLEDALNDTGWALVWTAAGKFLGQLSIDEGHPHANLRYPLEFHDTLIPQQVQGPQGPQLVFGRHIQTFPVSNCLDIEHTLIDVIPVNILWFGNMTRADAEWHKNLIRGGIKAAMEQRARNVGIILPGSNIQTGNA